MRQSVQAYTATTDFLEKASIFRNRDGRVACQTLPYPAPVDQGTTVDIADEEASVQLRSTSPRLPLRQIKETGGLQARDICLFSEQWFYLVPQAMWSIPIVVVPLGNNSSASLFASNVTLCANRGLRG